MNLQIYRAKEKDWIEGCKRQNREAQQALFNFFSGKMYAICCRYIKDKMEAEDVLVIAFTKIFERIDQYKNQGSLEGWIRKIIVNDSLSYLRKNKTMYSETDIQEADCEPDYDRIESQLEAEYLMKLIDTLPTGYRIVFNLYAIDGFSHQEIANQLGISESTSKSQLSRARTFIQKKLLEEDVLPSQKINEYGTPIG